MKLPVIYLSCFTSYKAYKKTYSLELLVLNTLQQKLLVSSYSPSVNSSFSLYFSKAAHTQPFGLCMWIIWETVFYWQHITRGLMSFKSYTGQSLSYSFPHHLIHTWSTLTLMITKGKHPILTILSMLVIVQLDIWTTAIALLTSS